MVGRVVLSGWTCAAPGTVAAGAGPGDEGSFGGGAGVVAVGTSSGEDCGDGVCAQAPKLRDEIRKDVDASKTGRNDKTAPCHQGERTPQRH